MQSLFHRTGTLAVEPERPGEREPDIEFREADNVFVKVNTFLTQRPSVREMHKHAYSHVSVFLGRFRVFLGDADGIPFAAPYVDVGGPGQPQSLTIEAGRYHRIMCLSPGGKLMCIWNGDHWDEEVKTHGLD